MRSVWLLGLSPLEDADSFRRVHSLPSMPTNEERVMSVEGNLLICGATMVLPEKTIIGDLRVSGGKISEISVGGGLKSEDNELFVDGTGLHLLPGAIDPQVHFRDPGQPEKEDLASGSAAGVSGGITSFLDMPNNKPAITTLDGMMTKLETASKKCISNYGFFIGATEDNVEELQKAV